MSSSNDGPKKKKIKDPVFSLEEIVWAKVRGFPWWPAHVTEIREAKTCGEHKYKISFFADDTHSVLVESKIQKFKQKIHEHSKPKQKALQEAIGAANKVLIWSEDEEAPIMPKKGEKRGKKTPVGRPRSKTVRQVSFTPEDHSSTQDERKK